MRISNTIVKLTILFLMLFFLATTSYSAESIKRPTILFNRWQEDWSVLVNPQVPREPLDCLKYIPLSASDPKTYLSLGADLRERYEYNNALNFGVGTVPQSYVISRMEAHADLHIANQIQMFMQIQSDFAPWKSIILPVDEDRLSLEQAFVSVTEPMGNGTFKFRTGRQQFAFDLQRFISLRDGPNVRQSFDAVWVDYETGPWTFLSFYSYPVVNRNIRIFDDYSSSDYTFGLFRIQREISNLGTLSSYVAHFKNANAFYPSVQGNEHRNILDIRFAGGADSFKWDIEAMGQLGHIANKNIRAWAFGSRTGYTFENVFLQPAFGLQLDAASGNHNTNGNTLGTFNPLFPNGVYLTLSGYTGYANFIHLKPSFSLTPLETITAMLSVAAQWRATTADAVYTIPDTPVSGTVGQPGRYTGTYIQLNFDWQMTPHIHNALEVDRFYVADAIRHVGGRNSTYVGLETKLSW